MTKSVVFSSVTGNTKLLAEHIKAQLGEVSHFGAVSDESLESDIIFVGFWTTKFSCGADIKSYLEKLNNKKVFLFGTAGYNSTPEYYNSILDEVKKSVNDTNEIVGTFMCQGKVSDNKQKALKDMDLAKYEGMKANLDDAGSHPDKADITAVMEAVSSL